MSGVNIWISGAAFAIVHSALASRACKRRIAALGVSPQAWRLTYSVLAVMLTFLWLGWVRELPNAPAWHATGAAAVTLILIQSAGVGIVALSLKAIDVPAFLGLRPQTHPDALFVERGVYRHMRHPMYTGVMLVLAANPLQTINSLHLLGVVSLYFILGARLEERRMLEQHPEYADYRRRVPAFVPRLSRLAKRRS